MWYRLSSGAPESDLQELGEKIREQLLRAREMVRAEEEEGDFALDETVATPLLASNLLHLED